VQYRHLCHWALRDGGDVAVLEEVNNTGPLFQGLCTAEGERQWFLNLAPKLAHHCHLLSPNHRQNPLLTVPLFHQRKDEVARTLYSRAFVNPYRAILCQGWFGYDRTAIMWQNALEAELAGEPAPWSVRH
jgi:hypothetical protein